MSTLSDGDLRLLLGDNYEATMESDRKKERNRLNKVKLTPAPPNHITRTGAWLFMLIAISSIGFGILVITSTHDSTLYIDTILSFISSILMIVSSYNVLRGMNTGNHRISGSIAILLNCIFLTPLLIFYFSAGVSVSLSFMGIISLVALLTWFWDATDCIQ